MNKQEMIDRVKVLAGMGTLEDDEVKELEKLNGDLSALKAREVAAKLMSEEAADEKERIEREKREAVAEAVKAEQAKSRRLQYSEAPYVTQFADTNKFDELDAVETALVIETLNSQNKPVSGAAFKALSLKIGEMKPADNSVEAIKSLNYIKNNFKAFNPRIGSEMAAIEAAVKAATDPMYSGGSGIGSDWVGTAYSSELWRSIRAANVIVSRVPADVIPDGYSSKYWPLEGADPTWYKVAEATASDATLKVPAATVAASQFGTSNKQINVSKIGARVLFTGAMNEDSLVAFAPELRNKMQVSGSEIIEHLFIDGDVETSANKNINDIAGTPAATDVFLSFDGFRKLALVTNTANSRSAGGALALEDYLETLRLMGTAGIAASDLSKVFFIVDPHVHYANMTLPEVKTRDVYSAATIENGFLKRAYGVEIMPSWQFAKGGTGAYALKANTAGKVDLDTNTNNTTGSILAVRPDQWKLGYKRRMTIELTRFANSDSWEIVALARFGLAYRDTEAAAISYNVGV